MSGKSRPEPRKDAAPERTDERDFAATMSDGAQDRPTEASATAEGRNSQRTGTDGAGKPPAPLEENDHPAREDAPDLVAQDEPRRKVTIPELPARHTAPTPVAKTPDVAETVQVDTVDATVRPADSPVTRSDPPPAALPAQMNAAPRAGLAAALAPAPTATATATAGATMVRMEAIGEPVTGQDPATGTATTETGQPRATAQAEPDARLAVPANAMHRMVRSQTPPRGALQAPVDDRAEPRGRDPLARATEAVAAAPAPTPQASAAHSSVTAQMAGLQPATRDTLTVREKTETLLSLDGEAEEGLRFDLRGSSGTSSTQQGSFAAAMSRADLPRGVAMQIADIARAMPDRPVDVALSPEELGRVRLSISTSEGGVTLHVLAERPETLDLMRRHADQLARELADLGFTSIDLGFGKGRDPESGDGDHAPAPGRARGTDETDAASTPDRPAPHLTLGPTGGLDIRI